MMMMMMNFMMMMNNDFIFMASVDAKGIDKLNLIKFLSHNAAMLAWYWDCNSVSLLVHLSHACFVIKPKNTVGIF